MDVASTSVRTEAAGTGRFLGWFTPWRCRIIFALLMAWGVRSHWQYLTHNCPLGLSGDEAHYWDWSRQLGLSYYSKGPVVAYIIRASCACLGETMPAVRLPAMVLAVGTALLTYWLIVKLFRSDRLALGSALLSHCVPVFIAGSILMTIDPPFFFCWAAATCLAVKAIFDESKWAWPALGVVVGIGFLAKYAMLLWFVCFGVFLYLDPASRKYLKSPRLWVAVGISLLFTMPVLMWNAQHGWVSFKHVNHQVGTGFKWLNPVEFIAGQAGIVGLSLFFILLGAINYVIRFAQADAHRRALIYLTTIGLCFFGIVGIDSFRTKIQPNWPAPAYFTLMILAAYFLSLRLKASAPNKWWWRGNLVFVVITAFILTPVAHDFSVVYPYVPAINKILAMVGVKKGRTPRTIDPTYKLRGGAELGQRVQEELAKLSPGAFVFSDDYQETAILAFYVPGQPRTYYSGSYKTIDPARFCQYDMWPDRSLEPEKTLLKGKDAILVGGMNNDIRGAFASVQRLAPLTIYVHGYNLRGYDLWACRGFKGLERPKNGNF